MMAWICSTSVRMALRVCTMRLLHRCQFLARFVQSLLYLFWGSPAGNIVAGDYRFQLEVVIDVESKSRAELLKFCQGQLRKLASFFQASLHRVCDRLMRLAKGHATIYQISGRGKCVHETTLAGLPHALKIEFHLAHESNGYLY